MTRSRPGDESHYVNRTLQARIVTLRLFPVDLRPELGVSLGRMSTRRDESERIALLQGTLDLLILRTLLFGREHGQGIARAIQAMSGDEILIDHGSLYPALQRLETKGFVSAEWGVSENNRRARFYTLTGSGKKQITLERKQWERVAAAVGRVLSAANPAG